MTTLVHHYIRFSSDKQADGDSVRRQQSLFTDWLKGKQSSGENLKLGKTIEDHGVSAFSGANLTDGAFGRFLKEVDSGKVPKGGYLVMENLDRLSRLGGWEATTMLGKLLVDYGFVVITLSPYYEYRREDRGIEKRLGGMFELERGSSESEQKKVRVRAAKARGREAAARGVKINLRVPNWIDAKRVTNGMSSVVEFTLNEEKAELVRRIFRMCLEGVGAQAIATKLAEEQVPHITKPTKKERVVVWTQSNVLNVLRNRAVLGEYQPQETYRVVDKKRAARKPAGAPIRDYYPRVVDDNTFARAQQVLKDRERRGAGRDYSFKNRNLFSRLVLDPQGLTYIHRVGKGIGYLRTRAPRLGDTAVANLQYAPFEEVMLSWIERLRMSPDEGAARLEGLCAEVKELEAGIKKMTERIAANPLLDSLYDTLAVLKIKHQQKVEELQEVDVPRQDALSDTQELIRRLRSDESGVVRNQLRQRVRDLLLAIKVERVQGVVFRPEKTVYLRVEFRDGSYRLLKYSTNREGLVSAEPIQDGDQWSGEEDAEVENE